MGSRYAEKLNNLGFKRSKACTEPTDELLQSFKDAFGLSLPNDFQEFLKENAGKKGEAICKFQEPTPMGKHALINSFFGFSDIGAEDIYEMTELIDGYPTVVALGSNAMGAMFAYICDGTRAGQVIMLDHEHRSSWSDDRFHKMYSKLSSDIKEYLQLRREGQLPEKDEGLEDIYIVAHSFSEFIEGLNGNGILG